MLRIAWAPVKVTVRALVNERQALSEIKCHEPLPVFAGGGHATLALLDTRSCLTCHTFQNACAECHTGALSPQTKPSVKP